MGWFASISSSWLKMGLSNGLHHASSASAADRFCPVQAVHPTLQQAAHHHLPAQPCAGQAGDAMPVVSLAPPTMLANTERHSPPLKMRSRHERSTAGAHPKKAVRLVISGRMADVCAELERLAANEARLCNTVLH